MNKTKFTDEYLDKLEEELSDENVKIEFIRENQAEKNKALMISIRPQHAVNILNGNKTLELRKTVPKGFKGWVYIYVTKGKPYIRELGDNYFTECSKVDVYKLNGKVVARFWFDEYEEITLDDNLEICTNEISHEELLKQSCVGYNHLNNYFMNENGDVFGYAWHIKKLGVFDTPLSFSDFGIKRPPQSWQYVYVKEQDDE